MGQRRTRQPSAPLRGRPAHSRQNGAGNVSKFNNDLDNFHEEREAKAVAAADDKFWNAADNDSSDSDNVYEIKGDEEFPSEESDNAGGDSESGEDGQEETDAAASDRLPYVLKKRLAYAQRQQLSDDSSAAEAKEEASSGSEDSEYEAAAAADWGKSKEQYYDGDDYEIASENEEEREEVEEREALRLQKKRAKALKTSEDFDDFLESATRQRRLVDEQRKGVSNGSSRRGPQDGASAPNAPFIDLDDLDVGDMDAAQQSAAVELVESVSAQMDALTPEERLRMVQRDSPELLDLLKELKEKVQEARNFLAPLLEKVKSANLATEKGISFLEVKYQLLLSYCLHICFYLLLKAEGRSVKDHPVVTELLKIRTYLEKLRPIENKLKYQMEKLIQVANSHEARKSHAAGQTGSVDPGDDALSYRPNPAALQSEDMGDENGDDRRNRAEGADGSFLPLQGGKYEAPRYQEVMLEGQKNVAARREKVSRKMEQLARKSSLLKTLRDEFGDAPVEMRSIGAEYRDMEVEDEAERNDFEEDHFTRTTLSREAKKQQKAKRARFASGDGLADVDDFQDLARVDRFLSREQQRQQAVTVSEADRENALQEALKSIQREEHRERQHKRSRSDADADRPVNDRQATARAHRMAEVRRTAAAEGADAAPVDENGGGSDDEFYKQVEEETRQRKKARQTAKNESKRIYLPAENGDGSGDEADQGRKRKATDQIVKNRGLVVHRKKEDRNPRLKMKRKFEKAVIRRKGQVRPMREQHGAYMGESTSIRKNVSHSVRL